MGGMHRPRRKARERHGATSGKGPDPSRREEEPSTLPAAGTGRWYNERALTRWRSTLLGGLWCACTLLGGAPAFAQAPPPRIGPWVIDVHGTVPRFPRNDALAASRGLVEGELPKTGLGLHGGAHVYPFSWKAVTFGLGVDITLARAHHGAVPLSDTTTARPVTATLRHVAPQLSLNFGTGDGWSYLSAGMGKTRWTIVPDAGVSLPPDEEGVRTVNYGGGARWFDTPRLAFSIDVRLYDIDPTSLVSGSILPTTPRTRMLIIGAGVSFK